MLTRSSSLLLLLALVTPSASATFIFDIRGEITEKVDGLPDHDLPFDVGDSFTGTIETSLSFPLSVDEDNYAYDLFTGAWPEIQIGTRTTITGPLWEAVGDAESLFVINSNFGIIYLDSERIAGGDLGSWSFHDPQPVPTNLGEVLSLLRNTQMTSFSIDSNLEKAFVAGDITTASVRQVPEPGTLGMLLAALLGMFLVRRELR